MADVSVGQFLPIAPPECHYDYGYDTCNVGVDGAVGMPSVRAPSSCSWIATSNASFITITEGNGTGTGTFNINVGPNSTAGLRSGAVTISGYPYSIVITQQGCGYGVSPQTINVVAAGGPATVAVTTTGRECFWTATGNASFIATTSGSSGTGSGTVTFAVAANAGPAARTGTLTIAGYTVTVTQAGP